MAWHRTGRRNGESAIVHRFSDVHGDPGNTGTPPAWQSLNRPEDLAFYAADGSCWLGSIAHERDAFIVLDSATLAELRAAVPERSTSTYRRNEVRCVGLLGRISGGCSAPCRDSLRHSPHCAERPTSVPATQHRPDPPSDRPSFRKIRRIIPR